MLDKLNKISVSINVILAIAAIAAVAVSINSCIVSNNANTLSEMANTNSKEANRLSEKANDISNKAFNLARKQHEESTAQVEANLHPHRDHFEPLEKGSPTFVSVVNKGSNEALVTLVILHDWEPLRLTLPRISKSGATKVREIHFTKKHLSATKNEFVFPLEPKENVEGGKTLGLVIFMDDPSNSGKTYIGKLTIIYNGGKKCTANVEIDVP